MPTANHVIKSFKYDGHLHRMWLENWLVPATQMFPEHEQLGCYVCVNHNTMIREADGKMWKSKIPGITFFLPDRWYNIVALIEQSGVRYYCNIASKPLLNGNVFTYIDYDLDVVLYPNGNVLVLDREEFAVNAKQYQYPVSIIQQVEQSLAELLQRIERRDLLFNDEHVYAYHKMWKNTFDIR